MNPIPNRGRAAGTRLAAAALPLLLLLGACEDYPTEGPDAGGIVPSGDVGIAGEDGDIGTASHGWIVRPKGYVYVRSPLASGPVNNSRTYNDGGGAVRLERIGYGLYRVFFDGLGPALNGRPHVQVKPAGQYTGKHAMCSASEPSRANNVSFFVQCTKDDYIYTFDMAFEAQIFDHDVQAAFATIAPNGSADNYRGISRAFRERTGRYNIYFKKYPYFGDGPKPVAFVTTDSGTPNCQLLAIDAKGQKWDEYGVAVWCFNRNGHPKDTRFHVLLADQPDRGGHAFLIDGGTEVWDEYSYNSSGGDITVARTAPGRYTVRFHELDYAWFDDGTAMVTAHGANNEACWAYGPTKQGGDVLVKVFCDKPGGGRYADSRYTVAVMTK